MICNVCGKQIPEGSSFCPLCGAQLSPAPAGKAAPAPVRKKRPVSVALILGIVIAILSVSVSSIFAVFIANSGDRAMRSKVEAIMETVAAGDGEALMSHCSGRMLTLINVFVPEMDRSEIADMMAGELLLDKDEAKKLQYTWQIADIAPLTTDPEGDDFPTALAAVGVNPEQLTQVKVDVNIRDLTDDEPDEKHTCTLVMMREFIGWSFVSIAGD